MATVFQDFINARQRSLVRFLRANGLNAKMIRKEICTVYGGKYLSLKAVHNWVEKFSQGCSEVADDARAGTEVAETAVRRLLCCRFQRTGKAMGKVYQCWWRTCRETNVFSRFQYHMFYVLYMYICGIFTDSQSYMGKYTYMCDER
jgi:hypothetical protein